MTKRIPTLLALLLLTGGVGLTVVATQSVRTLFTQAQTTTAPKNIRVTNISDTSFTVTYVTDVAAKGSAGLVGQTFFPDDRDQSLSSSDSYYTHYVTVKNLSPSTEYQYQVEGGTATYKITTAPTVTQTASLAEPVYGKVVKKDGTPAAGAIVYFSPFGGSPVSTYVKPNGNFLLSVNSLRTSDLSAFMTLKDGDAETMFIEGGPDGITTVTCQVGKDKPIPNITLGRDVNCSATSLVLRQTSSGTTSTGGSAVTITTPTEGETLLTGLPTFRGTAPIKKIIQIEIRSTSITANVVTDNAGNWAWPISQTLAAGNYILTVSYLDDTGTTQSLTRNFKVTSEKPGKAVLAAAIGTPSATMTPTPIPTPKPTPTPVVVSNPPVTGSEENMLIFLTAGMFLITLGISTIYKAIWTH